jgi:hypothetical protein
MLQIRFEKAHVTVLVGSIASFRGAIWSVGSTVNEKGSEWRTRGLTSRYACA